MSAGTMTFILRAAMPIAPSKQADQPAANSCSGLVPLPVVPGADSLMSRCPSELRETPRSRPPVVCVLAVYSSFSGCARSRVFMVMVLVENCLLLPSRAIGMGSFQCFERDVRQSSLRLFLADAAI